MPFQYTHGIDQQSLPMTLLPHSKYREGDYPSLDQFHQQLPQADPSYRQNDGTAHLASILRKQLTHPSTYWHSRLFRTLLLPLQAAFPLSPRSFLFLLFEPCSLLHRYAVCTMLAQFYISFYSTIKFEINKINNIQIRDISYRIFPRLLLTYAPYVNIIIAYASYVNENHPISARRIIVICYVLIENYSLLLALLFFLPQDLSLECRSL
ncbi:membrane protein of unknown function [Paenibacillus alvei]|uniref:Uncharacterized protein n=1 Tax=Paenibacillus alvei TaxID=44250 RepID=A0A383RA03_PAEAL|nr:membrane protein of unknown function [Paenibacillus alvei]